jgi:uncharacterized OsmC-like protein
MSELIFSVKAQSGSATRTDVEARGFSIVVDEPPSLGGDDAGPNPVEYLLAALAGCINVVGHLVAREMGFELRALDMQLEGALNPARFLNTSTEERAGYKAVDVRLRVDADADEQTLVEWARAVEARCPVSDNIGHATPVRLTVNS